MFLVFSQGPGGFRELREASRNHIHLPWYLSDAVVTSYSFHQTSGLNNSLQGCDVQTTTQPRRNNYDFLTNTSDYTINFTYVFKL